MAPDAFADHYRGIYARGLAGERPDPPIAWEELERLAEERMDPAAADYVFANAGSGDTARENLAAFRRWRIVPRMLRDVAERDLGIELFGTRLPAPVLWAPIGAQTIVHADGELATARAAAAVGLPLVVSTASSTALEEIAAAAGDAPRWYQLYWSADDAIARSMVSRAEQAGYAAIVLTVDTYIPGWKPRDLQRADSPFLRGVGTAQYFSDPVFQAGLERPPEEDVGAAVGHFLGIQANPSLSWENVEELREMTELPIVIKGILHPDDARMARERGADAIVVSNHGGRQVDGAIASLEALPEIAEILAGELPILLDSGIRGGADVFKALALGADAVLLGRPYLWGLALGGEAGVEEILRRLLAELDLTLGLSGFTRPAELGPAVLRREMS